MTRTLQGALTAACLLGACGDDASSTTPDATAEPDAPAGCPRTPPAADRTRYVVVSRPYDANGDRSGLYEVLELSATGELARFMPPRTFEMERASFGTIAFTPDARLGFVATELGKVAAFRLDEQGMPTTLTPGTGGTFYASRVVVDPSGDHLWVVDTNTKENAGGIYGVSIGCDGTLTDRGNVIPADFPGAFVLAPGTPGTPTRAMIAARSIYDGASPVGDDVHHVLLDGDPPGRLAGADAFGDDEAIVGGAAFTHDGKYFLVGDTNGTHVNRIAIVSVDDVGVAPRKILMPFPDPQGIVTSPFGNVALATSTLDGDAIHILDRLGAMGSWRDAGEVTYVGGRPQLPGDLVMIDRGTLAGHVFVSENIGVRHLAFRQTGDVEDLGPLAFPDGLENILGAIGVTP